MSRAKITSSRQRIGLMISGRQSGECQFRMLERLESQFKNWRRLARWLQSCQRKWRSIDLSERYLRRELKVLKVEKELIGEQLKLLLSLLWSRKVITLDFQVKMWRGELSVIDMLTYSIKIRMVTTTLLIRSYQRRIRKKELENSLPQILTCRSLQ